MISSFISLVAGKAACCYLIAAWFDKEDIYYSYAVGWVLGLLISGIYYASGKWKHKSIVSKLREVETA